MNSGDNPAAWVVDTSGCTCVYACACVCVCVCVCVLMCVCVRERERERKKGIPHSAITFFCIASEEKQLTVRRT